ncbi:MAG TPA: class IV adenylate cyclase [Ktedonobacterales bacterium]|jgi:adenylate cyclase class IV
MRNVEAKFRCPEAPLAEARSHALAAGARSDGVLEQTDTYFHCLTGRLKLREIVQDGRSLESVLIGYARPDIAGARASNFTIVPIPDPAALKAALGATLGVRVRVAKRREVLWLRHTRIHLDAVRDLGTYVELETLVVPAEGQRNDVAGAADDEEAARELAEVAAMLGFTLAEAVPGSYADLLVDQHPDGAPTVASCA